MNKFMGDSWLIFVAPQAIRDIQKSVYFYIRAMILFSVFLLGFDNLIYGRRGWCSVLC